MNQSSSLTQTTLQELTKPKSELAVNSSFSTKVPNLQIAWDSTSLGALKTCPRYYQLAIVEGWQSRRLSVHLIFGLHYHSTLEAYDHAKCKGASHREAMEIAIQHVMEVTWDSKLQRPWTSDDQYKNRETLVRTVVWYMDQFEDDPLKTVVLANGKPAVELSFRYETDYISPEGSPYMICGHLDRLATLNDEYYVVDRKTSKSTIDERFFASFTPHNQFSIYVLSSKIVYGIMTKGLIVDGAQVAVTFSRFRRGTIPRSDASLDEFYKSIGFYILQAEIYAKANFWPMNEASCGNYGGCSFRGICSKSPQVREQWLKADFAKRVWDPLKVRGDV